MNDTILPQQNKIKILIIGSEQFDLNSYKEAIDENCSMLESQTFGPVNAFDEAVGSILLKKISCGQFNIQAYDVLVVSYLMSGINGVKFIEFLNEIVEDSQINPCPPVVLITKHEHYFIKDLQANHFANNLNYVCTMRSNYVFDLQATVIRVFREHKRQMVLEAINENTIYIEKEFRPEHLQAGLQILNYFSSTFKKMYPEKHISVAIEQTGTRISIKIQPETGDRTIVANAFHRYGMVVVGEIAPEDLLHNPNDVIELKHKLELANIEKRHAYEMLNLTRSQFENRISSLESFIQNDNERFATIIKDITHTNKNLKIHCQTNTSINVDLTKTVDQVQVHHIPRILKALKAELKDGTYYDPIEYLNMKLDKIEEFMKDGKPDMFGVRNNLKSIVNFMGDAASSIVENILSVGVGL